MVFGGSLQRFNVSIPVIPSKKHRKLDRILRTKIRLAMEKKDTSKTDFGDISTIRNVLMGEKMGEYETQFQEIKKHLTSIEEKIVAMEKQQTIQMKKNKKEMETKLDRLEDLLLTNIHDINTRLEAVTTDERKDLGRLLGEMGERLLKK